MLNARTIWPGDLSPLNTVEIWIHFGILRNISHDKWEISDWSLNSVKVERLCSTCNLSVTQHFIWTTMALKKLTSLLMVFACRFMLFLVISLLSSILQGIPNINSCFLTVSIFNLRRSRIAFRFFDGDIWNSRTTVRLPNLIRLSAAKSFGTDLSSSIWMNHELAGRVEGL